MAEPITKPQVEALATVPYADLRPTLKSGDLLFASGDYWVSQAIQKVTDSPWSHVGILFHVKALDRVLLLESVEDMGVRFAPLSKYFEDYERGRGYRGQIVVARVDGLRSARFHGIATHGIDTLTRPYDKDEIAKIVARVALGRGRWKRDREYICSELVAECFEQAGITFSYDRRGFISPRNLWEDGKVRLLDRVW